MLYNSTKKKIQEIQQQVDLITDGLGLPIDDLIKPAVVALRLWGFPTSASCQGHTDWGLPYPWIDIDTREWDTPEFWNSDPESEVWRKIVSDARKSNHPYEVKMREVLEPYTASKVNSVIGSIKITGYDGLTLDKSGFSGYRLKATSIEKMNEFADYLVRRYDFCSSPEQKPSSLYMEEKDYQDLLELMKEPNGL